MRFRFRESLRKTRLYVLASGAYDSNKDAPRAAIEESACGGTVEAHGIDNVFDCCGGRQVRNTTVLFNGDGNSIWLDSTANVDGLSVVITGSRNSIRIGASQLASGAVRISGDGCVVSIGDGCHLNCPSIVCEDDRSSVTILEGSEIAGYTELAALEGTAILVGERCLFSGGVHLRTGDSHSVVDLEGRRINPSKDITIGDHVWVGQNVTILKGVRVGDNSIIGASAVVTKAFDVPNIALAGNPARVVRENVDWRAERIACED